VAFVASDRLSQMTRPLAVVGSILVGLLVWAAPTAAGEAVPPPVTAGPPVAGRRVRITPPEHAGTAVHHTLYLPADWSAPRRDAGDRWSVIVEYAGNFHPASGSAGTVEGAVLGYGLTRGTAIWAVLPCVAADGRGNTPTWWGDEAATIAYAKANVPRICREFGGDPGRVVLCGFSRGAIAASYIGLADDEIARLWCGLVTHDHFDGEREWPGTAWGSPLDRYRAAARERLTRLARRPLLVCQAGGTAGIRRWLDSTGLPLSGTAYLDVRIREIFPALPHKLAPGIEAKSSHTDRWVLVESPDTRTARAWVVRAFARGDVATDDPAPVR
jgi:hypothetical protein